MDSSFLPKLVSEFAGVLTRHYPRETEVRANGECVTVRMKQGQTTNSDGLGYDVVPCGSADSLSGNIFGQSADALCY